METQHLLNYPPKKRKHNINLYIIYILVLSILSLNIINLISLISLSNFIRDNDIMNYINKLKHLIDDACAEMKC